VRKGPVYVIAGFAVTTLILWVYLPVLSRYRELKSEETGMQEEIEQLDRKIDALEEEKYLLRNDVSYLEKVIRDELGLVRDGETVYRIVEEALPQSAGSKAKS